MDIISSSPQAIEGGGGDDDDNSDDVGDHLRRLNAANNVCEQRAKVESLGSFTPRPTTTVYYNYSNARLASSHTHANIYRFYLLPAQAAHTKPGRKVLSLQLCACDSNHRLSPNTQTHTNTHPQTRSTTSQVRGKRRWYIRKGLVRFRISFISKATALTSRYLLRLTQHTHTHTTYIRIIVSQIEESKNQNTK